MNEARAKFLPFARRMQAEKLPELVINTFAFYYDQLLKGQTGIIREAEIQPVRELPDAETFSNELDAIGKAALAKTVILKLNGGLGTGMGIDKAKSLLIVKGNLTFLDILARNAQASGIPLVLMNSFRTHRDSVAHLQSYENISRDLPIDFLQHKVLKVRQDDLSPATCTSKPDLEWAPPGHGDIYPALITSGMLDAMLRGGYETMFVSNADNLGAVLDTAILGYFVKNRLPFMMEVADRTAADRKGGHLARQMDGQLILRESAQGAAEDQAAFQDIDRYKFFNTNNLWINLPALLTQMQAKNNILGLPMIRNSKTVDPRDPTSTPVYQLETAMGSAIGIFKGAGAVRVPRSRFAPVKLTSDLLLVRSNYFVLTQDNQIVPNPERKTTVSVIDLDHNFYKMIDDFEARFPEGSPDFLECKSLSVKGDFRFGKGVRLIGHVFLENKTSDQIGIPHGAIIQN
jgi:UTP--glucose-1-phosphate uridylyltransferase